jgi:hypothetical protein
MDQENLKKKLEELHHAVTDVVLEVVQHGRPGPSDADGVPVTLPASNDDIRTALQLLKQNNISVAATPEDPLGALAKALVGSRIPKGHLEARLRASPHLAALEAADSSAAVVAVEWQPQGQGLDTTP